jgi:hypothetical protein
LYIRYNVRYEQKNEEEREGKKAGRGCLQVQPNQPEAWQPAGDHYQPTEE